MVLLCAFFQLGSPMRHYLFPSIILVGNQERRIPHSDLMPFLREHKSAWKEEYGWFNAIFYAEQGKWQFLSLTVKP